MQRFVNHNPLSGRHRVPAWTFAVLLIAVAGCGGSGRPDVVDDNGSVTQDVIDAILIHPDVVQDSRIDTGFDVKNDVVEDLVDDVGSDVIEDAKEDAIVDTWIDTGFDSGNDAVEDVVADTGFDADVRSDTDGDTVMDADADDGMDPGPDAGLICTMDEECDDGDLCTDDWCDASTHLCVNPPIDCDDDNACTVDGCDSATGCTYEGVVCNDGDPCTMDFCDPLTGDCVYEPMQCEPLDACHDAVCVQGMCLFTAIVCDDGNACTTDGCDPLTGCTYAAVDCDDGDVCTTDSCDPATGCVHIPVDCDDGSPGTVDSCHPETGCVHVPIVCDDGNECTIEHWDTVKELCVYMLRDCDDHDACTTDGCDTASGCTNVPYLCDDGNACTVDVCDSTLGCVFEQRDSSDGDLCTDDSCDPLTGQFNHVPVDCDDGDVCTTDSCDPATGCVHVPVDCDDGTPGTVDSCHPETGCVHVPIVCDDGNACTTDFYDPARGCVNAPVVCDDFNACTDDSCDVATGCVHDPVVCTDFDACTDDSCDGAIGCVHNPVNCDDFDACTSDGCDPATGCANFAVVCDDGNECTVDFCDPATGCVTAPVVCDDNDACTTDSCDPAAGCTHTWICNDEICDNGTDDNDDGLRDCADPACFADDACHGDSCDDPVLLPGTAVVNIDTIPLTAGFPAGCETTPGTDVIFRLDVAVPSDVHLSTVGSDYDTALSIRAAPCTSTAYLACNDDIGPRLDASRVELLALPAGTWFVRVSDASGGNGGNLRLNVVVTPSVPANWPSTTQDPLVRMPGTQPTDGVTLETPDNCASCHSGFDPPLEPSRTWRGSMMAQASRDFLFWTTMTVAVQDSLWALGTPNAADICERCHFPKGWVEGRSDPPNASAMTGFDYDGVHCDVCHSMVDPHFEDTFAGTREGADWLNYWDETNLSGTPSATAAAATRTADQTALSVSTFFNGQPYFDPATFRPVPETWNENASGQYFLSTGRDKRGPFADAGAKHPILYSRHHKSRYFCATCHDVTNPALSNLDYAGALPGPGVPQLPSETRPAWDMTHVERTFSEFMLSAFGAQGGATGTGAFDPATFTTSFPGNSIATCQDCHMVDLRGKAANKTSAVLRPDNSTEHPNSGVPDHSMAGGNPFVLRVLASTVPGSTNYDPVNAALLNGQTAALTMDLTQGFGVDPAIALEGADKAVAMLEAAASIEGLSYDPASGSAVFRVVNHTGHKLLSGFPEGRRVFVNVRAWQGDTLIAEINPYDAAAGTLRGLDLHESPASPPLGAGEEYDDDLVYECRMASSLTGEEHSFHFVLSTHRDKDNRVPPAGFRIAEAAARRAEPVMDGESDPDMFTAAEYAGGYDEIEVELPAGATRVEVTLYYQATSREYIEFLRDEIAGETASLTAPSPAGGAMTYVSGDNTFFDGLRAWGDTIWQLWDHNRNVPGAAPIPVTQASWTP